MLGLNTYLNITVDLYKFEVLFFAYNLTKLFFGVGQTIYVLALGHVEAQELLNSNTVWSRAECPNFRIDQQYTVCYTLLQGLTHTVSQG